MVERKPHRINALGAVCPLPVLLVLRDIKKLDVGDLIELTGDDPGILEDIPAFCELNGHELLSMDDEEGVIVCLIEKRAHGGAAG